MHKSTVILYYPKQDIKAQDQFQSMPFSLLALAAVLDTRLFNVKIIDGFFDRHPEEEIKQHKNIIAVGVTVITGPGILDALKFSKLVKKIHPKVPVVWGGSHPSVCVRDTISDPHVDYVIKGQGEIPFVRLLQCLLESKTAENIPGLAMKKGKQLIDNPMELPKNINEFPHMPFHLIDIGRYVTSYPLIGKRTIVYVTSQGCPFGCKFCSDVVLYRNKWSGWSANRMLQDIIFFKEQYDVDSIMFFDNNFFVDINRVLRLCRLLIEHKINIKWCADVRIDQINRLKDDELALITRAGGTSFLVGAESGNKKVLELINKRMTPEDTVSTAVKCKKHKIKVVYSFMSGFPGMFEEEFQDSISLIMKLREIDLETRVILCTYAPYPGAELTQSYRDLIISPETLSGWAGFSQTNNSMRWLRKKESRMLRSIANFYLPCAFSNLGLWNEIRLLGEKTIVVRFLHRVLQQMALFRLKNKIYHIRFEDIIVNLVFGLRRFLKKTKRGFLNTLTSEM